MLLSGKVSQENFIEEKNLEGIEIIKDTLISAPTTAEKIGKFDSPVVNNLKNVVYKSKNECKLVGNNFCFAHTLCDGQWLLSESNGKETAPKITKCPEVCIKIGNVETYGLLDSGSILTCLDFNFYEKHKRTLPKHEILPIQNVTLTTAVGQKTKRLKYMIYIDCQLGSYKFIQQMLTVPNLIKDVIIGVDMLDALEMVIDFKKCILIVGARGQKPATKNEKDTNNCSAEKSAETIPLKLETLNKKVQVCHLIQHQRGYPQMENLEEYEKVDTITSHDSIEDEINKKVSEIVGINQEEKQQVANLLYKYKNIFSDQPGLCNKYEYKIKLKENKPYKSQSYPIPARYQEQVSVEIEKMLQSGIKSADSTIFLHFENTTSYPNQQ